MAAITQISKIQLRRGAEQELDEGSLDTAELGFTTDSHRLFIGTSLTTPPVEVLTETSLETFARLHDRMDRAIGPLANSMPRQPYLEAALAPNTAAWTNVRVFSDGELIDNDLVLSLTRSLSAEINYFLFDGSRVMRSGALHIMHDGNGPIDEAVLTDQHVADFQLAATGTPILASQLFVTGVRFRVMRSGTNPSYSFRLQYINETTKPLRVQMRVMVAAKPQA